MPYISVEHEPGVWVDAHVEKQWKSEGRWRLSVYYFVGALQYYRVYDADQCRPVSSVEPQDDEQRDAAAEHEPAYGRQNADEPIDLRDAQQVAPRD